MVRRYGHANLSDKPYFYTPLPQTFSETAPASHASYQIDRLSGQIGGVIVARSPIHIASGQIVTWADLSRHGDINSTNNPPLIAAHFRTNDRRAIPASSLKGVLRSIVEAISYSCPQFSINKQPGRHKRVNVINISAEHHRCQVDTTQDLENNNLCPACRIFGGIGSGSSKGGYLGNVNFTDAVQEAGGGSVFARMPLYSPQPSYSQALPRKRTGYKLYFRDRSQTEPLGRKFFKIGIPQPKTEGRYEPIEVCDEKSTFRLQIQFSNLTAGELGLLLMALGCSATKTFALKLGGGKPLSLGTFQVNSISLEYFDIQTTWSTYDSKSKNVTNLQKYVDAAYDEDLIHQPGWDVLTHNWHYPPQDSCPGGQDQSY